MTNKTRCPNCDGIHIRPGQHTADGLCWKCIDELASKDHTVWSNNYLYAANEWVKKLMQKR